MRGGRSVAAEIMAAYLVDRFEWLRREEVENLDQTRVIATELEVSPGRE